MCKLYYFVVIVYYRNQFNDNVKAAEDYLLDETSLNFCKPLPSTELPPHFSVAIDKSTPHRDTNWDIMLITEYLCQMMHHWCRNAFVRKEILVGGLGKIVMIKFLTF